MIRPTATRLTPMVHPHRSTPTTWTSALLAAALLTAGTATGCSTDGKSAAVAPEAQAGAPAAEAATGPIGVSSGGVTTRIEIPAQSTEEQYAQSCMAAKDWMAAKGGDPDTLVEPYLEQVQAAGESSPVTFNTTWANLTDPQRAAVLIAVRAAADGGC